MTDLSRRSVLVGLCALAATGLAASPADATTGVKQLPDGRLAVTVAKVPQLARPGGAVRIGSIDGTPIGVARTGARAYVAFRLSCPHAGVTVRGGSQGWACPAHGSQFQADGDLVLGPATTGLSRVRSRLAKGVLTVG